MTLDLPTQPPQGVAITCPHEPRIATLNFPPVTIQLCLGCGLDVQVGLATLLAQGHHALEQQKSAQPQIVIAREPLPFPAR